MNLSILMQLIVLHWRDLLEILSFSTLFYYISLWLRKDRQKNLLWYFYGYCGFIGFTYYVQLPTLSSFLFLFSPVIILLFIIIHQETLQRNLIAFKNILPKTEAKNDWLEIVLRACLVTINKNKAITCVLEQTDRLSDFLQTSCLVNAEVNDDLLNILIRSESYDEHGIIWINNQGKIISINAHWYQPSHTLASKKIDSWQDNALIYTTKTDALVFHINPISRTFSITIKGKQHDNISAHHAHSFIQKNLLLTLPKKEKGEIYGHISQKNSEHQRTP